MISLLLWGPAPPVAAESHHDMLPTDVMVVPQMRDPYTRDIVRKGKLSSDTRFGVNDEVKPAIRSTKHKVRASALPLPLKATRACIYSADFVSQPRAIKFKVTPVLIWSPSRTQSGKERRKAGQPHQAQGG